MAIEDELTINACIISLIAMKHTRFFNTTILSQPQTTTNIQLYTIYTFVPSVSESRSLSRFLDCIAVISKCEKLHITIIIIVLA